MPKYRLGGHRHVRADHGRARRNGQRSRLDNGGVLYVAHQSIQKSWLGHQQVLGIKQFELERAGCARLDLSVDHEGGSVAEGDGLL